MTPERPDTVMAVRARVRAAAWTPRRSAVLVQFCQLWDEASNWHKPEAKRHWDVGMPGQRPACGQIGAMVSVLADEDGAVGLCEHCEVLMVDHATRLLVAATAGRAAELEADG